MFVFKMVDPNVSFEEEDLEEIRKSFKKVNFS